MPRAALREATIAVLGVRYEPWSDDLRAAPSRSVVPAILDEAARVRVWDPATDAATVAALFPAADAARDLTEAVGGAHAVVLLTEWPQAIEADWSQLAVGLAEPRLLIDGKNCLPPERMASLSVRYRSVGTRMATSATAATAEPQLEA